MIQVHASWINEKKWQRIERAVIRKSLSTQQIDIYVLFFIVQ